MCSLSQEKPPIRVISTLAAIAVVSSDDDLIDAAMTELQALPTDRLATQDMSGQSDQVLYPYALVQGDHHKAQAILEDAVHVEPSNSSARNRLAKMLIASGKPEQAIGVLDAHTRVDAIEVVAETLRLKGMAEVLIGDEGGLRSLQRAIRLRPSDEVGRQGLAWGRKMFVEAQA